MTCRRINLLGAVIAFGFTVCALIAPQMAQAQGAIVGVNAAIGGLSVDQQNAILGELHAAGVHVIRTGITPDDKGVDLARRVLKDIRSHSKLNQHTPIISAGLVYNEAPAAPRTAKLDAVSAAATIDFMRARGLDSLVDAYGVHTYPWTDHPGDAAAAAAAGRRYRLAKYVLAQCQPEGAAKGKPCWVTEWGVPNRDVSCPAIESAQVALVRGTWANFLPYVVQKRVVGVLYYAWLDSREDFAVYRCSGLAESGRLAIAAIVVTEPTGSNN